MSIRSWAEVAALPPPPKPTPARRQPLDPKLAKSFSALGKPRKHRSPSYRSDEMPYCWCDRCQVDYYMDSSEEEPSSQMEPLARNICKLYHEYCRWCEQCEDFQMVIWKKDPSKRPAFIGDLSSWQGQCSSCFSEMNITPVDPCPICKVF